MKNFIYLALLISSTIYSQDIEILFGKYLPAEIKKNNENYTQALETLKRDALLNPNLIYYRLNYYDLLFNANEMDNTKNGFEIIRSLVSQEIDKKNKWLNEQISNAKKYKERSDFVNDVVTFFESQISSIVVDSTYTIESAGGDKNKINFFSLLCLSKDSTIYYNEQIDYQLVCDNLKNKISRELFNLLSTLKLDNKEVSEKYLEDQIIKYWYLFPVSNDSGVKINAEESFFRLLEKEYSSTEFDKFIFLIGVTYYYLNEVSEFEIYPEEISGGIQMAEVYNKNALTAQLGYRFFISGSYSILSYINTNINFSVGINSEVTEFDSLIYLKSDVSGRNYTSELWVLDQTQVSEPTIYSLYLRATTPVFIIGKNFTVEVGAMIGFSYLSYDITYSYDYTKVKVNWDEIHQRYDNELLARYSIEDRTETQLNATFRLYPTFDFNLLFLRPILFQFSTGYNLLEFKVGMTF